MSRNNYTSKSDGTADKITSTAQEFVNKASEPLSTVSGQLNKIAAAGFHAYKITLSEAGFWRQVMSFPTGAKSDKQKSVLKYDYKEKKYESRSSRKNTGDAIFICGEYALPLSINYSISASKKTAESQLVDGVNIVERIAKSARIVTLSFSLERVPTDNYAEQQATAINKQPSTVLNGQGTAARPTPLYTLQAVLAELYDEDEVFKIENNVLNNELGVKWAFIKDYAVVPGVGSTMFSVSMTLQEVNINDALLYTSPENAPTYTEIPEK